MASREAVLGLDRVERRVGLFGAILAFVIAATTAISWIRNVSTLSKVSPTGTNTCPTGYTFHSAVSLCEKLLTTSRTSWEIKFFFVTFVALCILYCTLRNKRAGVACFAVFLGLGVGSGLGIVFFAIGAWLIVRAYRLQKYGDATFAGSNRVAKEMSRAKREGRAPKLESSTKVAATSPRPVGKPATPPPASKRYTPKKPQRRR